LNTECRIFFIKGKTVISFPIEDVRKPWRSRKKQSLGR